LNTHQETHTHATLYIYIYIFTYIYIYRLYTWALVNGYMGTGNFEMQQVIDNAISTTKYKPTHLKTHHKPMNNVISDIYIYIYI
jgi:hypothetical protein